MTHRKNDIKTNVWLGDIHELCDVKESLEFFKCRELLTLYWIFSVVDFKEILWKTLHS